MYKVVRKRGDDERRAEEEKRHRKYRLMEEKYINDWTYLKGKYTQPY